MEKRIIKFIHQHSLLKKHSTVLVGTSGGPDSMALLHLLISLRKTWNLRIIALSLDHMLRGKESKEDVQYVRSMCNRWNVEVVTDEVDVRAYEEKHQVSKQVAARKLRYQFFTKQMNRFQADYLALGHHGDDQIETMLMNITRNASSSSLQGIPVKRKFATGFIIRPLLNTSKEQILKYCKQYDIKPRFDPSNQDLNDTRVFFREKVVPLMKEKNENLHTTIQHLSETLGEDELFFQKEAEKAIHEIAHFEQNDEYGKIITFKVCSFQAYAYALQRRFFHLILNYLYDGILPTSLSYTHESIFFELLNKQQGTVNVHFPRHLIIERSYGTVSFYFQDHKTDTPLKRAIAIPGETIFSDGTILRTRYVSSFEKNQDKYTYVCPTDSVHLPLYVRTRRPGDRMRWKGLKGSKKLKDLFIDEKVPIRKRDQWPIIVDSCDNILWVIGLRKNDITFTNRNTLWLQLHYEKGS